MQQVYLWSELVSEAVKIFPDVNQNKLILAENDVGLLVREIARAHELTLAEAAEMASLRLPIYEPDFEVRMSA